MSQVSWIQPTLTEIENRAAKFFGVSQERLTISPEMDEGRFTGRYVIEIVDELYREQLGESIRNSLEYFTGRSVIGDQVTVSKLTALGYKVSIVDRDIHVGIVDHNVGKLITQFQTVITKAVSARHRVIDVEINAMGSNTVEFVFSVKKKK